MTPTEFQNATLTEKIELAKEVYESAMLLGMVDAALEAMNKISELETALKAENEAKKIETVKTLNEMLKTELIRYDRANKHIADLKRDYYLNHKTVKTIMESDYAEELTALLAKRDKIDAQITSLDAQIEALENA